MYEIQINADPYQGIMTVLEDQQCYIVLRSISGIVYFSLTVTGLGEVCNSVKCVDRSPLIRGAYTGFKGDFMFIDTQEEAAPTYDKFGTRYKLVYDKDAFKGAENIW